MNRFFEIRNNACEVTLSESLTIGRNVILGSRCKKIKIGFGCFIGNDIYIDVDCLRSVTIQRSIIVLSFMD